MAETWILLALLGLPLLGSDELRALLAVPLAVLGAFFVGIGVWAWADHRWPSAERRQDSDWSLIVPGGASDLSVRADRESQRQLEQGGGEEWSLKWRISERSRHGR